MVNNGLPEWVSLDKCRTIDLDRQVSNTRVHEFVQFFMLGGYNKMAKGMMVLTDIYQARTGDGFTPLAISWEASMRRNAARLGLPDSVVMKDLETLDQQFVFIDLDGVHRVAAWFRIGENEELLTESNSNRAIDNKPKWERRYFNFEEALSLSVSQNKTEESVRVSFAERMTR